MVEVLNTTIADRVAEITYHVPANPLFAREKALLQDQPKKMTNTLSAGPLPCQVSLVIYKKRINISKHMISRFNQKFTVRQKAQIRALAPLSFRGGLTTAK